ncbi:MAG: phosphoglycerate kinase [Candidatus Bathyarchaeia archaeon]
MFITRGFLTLDDVDAADKTVFVRLDINSPIDPETGNILDDTRIRAAVPTLRDLSSARVVVGSHQSRPGKGDFISLQEHAAILRRYIGKNVRFIEDVTGPAAREAIEKLRNGEVLVLDNLRLCSEEVIECSVKQMMKTILAKRLAPLFDLFVNDAFAAAHRSQASLIMFPEFMPSAVGRTMEKELKALGKVLESPNRPCVFALGGVKVDDRIPVIENVLKTGVADRVLLGGLVAEFFMKASGFNLGAENEKKLKEFNKFQDKARNILTTFGDALLLPTDVAVHRDGTRKDIHVGKEGINDVIMDIGVETTAHFASIIEKAGMVVADGPMGVFENQIFASGTREVLEAMADSEAYTVVGGGHVAGAAELLGLAEKISHVSTGGGAMLVFLSGQELPAVEALKRSAKRYGGKI